MLMCVGLVYRLDFSVNLFATSVAGMPVVVDFAELEAIRQVVAAVRSCWSSPSAEQLQSAVAQVLGRDPRQ